MKGRLKLGRWSSSARAAGERYTAQKQGVPGDSFMVREQGRRGKLGWGYRRRGFTARPELRVPRGACALRAP